MPRILCLLSEISQGDECLDILLIYDKMTLLDFSRAVRPCWDAIGLWTGNKNQDDPAWQTSK